MLKKLILILTACAFLAGCGATADKATSTGSGGQSKSEAELETGKYNVYVDQNNFMTVHLDKTLKDYFKFLSTGDQPKKVTDYKMISISDADLAIIEKAYKYAGQKPSFGAVDNDVKELYPKIKDLAVLLREAKSYYDAKGYAEDNYKKAQEMHTKIIKANEEYEALCGKFFASLDEFSVELEKKGLEELKKQGRMARYTAKDALNKAQELQQEIRRQNIKGANILSLDLQKFKERHDKLAEAVDQFTAYASDADKLKKEGINPDTHVFKMYVSSIKTVKAAAGEILERVSKQEPLDRIELTGINMGNKKGTVERFNKELELVIKNYNNWQN